MTRKQRRWVPVAVFWILFVSSIGLGRRYPRLDSIWYVVGMALLLGLSIYSFSYALRHRKEPDAFSSKGIPRWLERFLLDEPEDDPPTAQGCERHSASTSR